MLGLVYNSRDPSPEQLSELVGILKKAIAQAWAFAECVDDDEPLITCFVPFLFILVCLQELAGEPQPEPLRLLSVDDDPLVTCFMPYLVKFFCRSWLGSHNLGLCAC